MTLSRLFILSLLIFFKINVALANIKKNEFIIKINKNVDFYSIKQDIGKKFKIIDFYQKDGGYILVKSKFNIMEREQDFINYIGGSNENISYIVPNVIFKTFSDPNDPNFSKQWGLKKVKATEAWSKQSGLKKIKIAVIDTGIDLNHEDLRNNIWINKKETKNGKDSDNNGFIDDIHGWDFRDNDNNPNDETSSKNPGHGTHCAGIIGAVNNNGIGISGISPNISLIPIRFLGADGSGDLMMAIKSIDYAIKIGANIISASWGAEINRSSVKPLLEAIQRANEKGIIFVAAAANNGKSNDFNEVFPANAGFDNVISVAASDINDNKPSWSNFGISSVDISAPGVDIFSTLPSNKYKNLSGTSMATPLVAGGVAIILQELFDKDIDVNPLSVKSILQASGAKVDIEVACKCRMDMNSALNIVKEDTLVLVPESLTLPLNEERQFYGIGGTKPYIFTSSNQEVIEISESGLLKGIQYGSAKVSITDSNGNIYTSDNIHIKEIEKNETCPFDPAMCLLLCSLNPTLPWCKQSNISLLTN